MLEVKLNQYEGDKILYENIDLKINPGVTVLIGPNRNWQDLYMLSN